MNSNLPQRIECRNFDVSFRVLIRHIRTEVVHFPEHVQLWRIDTNGNYTLVHTERKNAVCISSK